MKGVLRLEIEKHQIDHLELENISESGSVTNDSVDPGDRITDPTFGKLPSNGSDVPQGSNSKWNSLDAKEISGNGSNVHGNPDFGTDDVSLEMLYCRFSLTSTVTCPLTRLLYFICYLNFFVAS